MPGGVTNALTQSQRLNSTMPTDNPVRIFLTSVAFEGLQAICPDLVWLRYADQRMNAVIIEFPPFPYISPFWGFQDDTCARSLCSPSLSASTCELTVYLYQAFSQVMWAFNCKAELFWLTDNGIAGAMLNSF